MKRAPLLLAAVLAGVLIFGFGYVAWKNLRVAYLAHEGAEGRVHYFTKNITRFGGGPSEVHEAVRRALLLETSADTAGSPTERGDWREAIRGEVSWSARPAHVVAVAGEGLDAPAWALPGAYWAAYAGVPLVFVGRDSAGSEALAVVQRLKVPVYLLAPTALVDEPVAHELAQVVPTTRVSADDPAAHAVRVAEYRDEQNEFGWGRTRGERTGYFQYVLAAPSEARHAIAALPLARSNATPVLFGADDGSVPAATDRYWWAQRAEWASTPAEGPFRHLWIAGDRTSYAAQGRLDLAPEKAPYPALGPAALGPLEGIALVYLALGIAGALFVIVHGIRLLPDVMPATRAAWVFTALLVPVLGVLLYLAAYRRPRLNPGEDMPKWLRPPAIQAAAATAMGFGYGAPLMVAIGYLFVFFGFPLAFGDWSDGWEFVAGAGMPRMMFGMYLFAVLLAWPFVQVPMKQMMSGASAKMVAWSALGVTALSMAAVSLGMMTTSWWMLMGKLRMMPHEDEILWFFALWLASTIGFLVAWPLNWPMVRAQLKPGTM